VLVQEEDGRDEVVLTRLAASRLRGGRRPAVAGRGPGRTASRGVATRASGRRKR
jgi:hypothetical protein